ncbi:hypothetical protein E4T48_04263 [Aureobasidium sp. EXF-10727]|nr:hypothetical protein E4T48_04263 [Aureobasidium sp. EXF-10727]KAI4732078.1 hypothetical protein E4T49_00320 [Aureobasidium sp. EXF-10728]
MADKVTQNTPDVAKEPLPTGRNPLNGNPGNALSQRSPTDTAAGEDNKKGKDDRDSSLKIKIELDLDVEVHLTARIKGDITIGLL